MKIDLSKKPEGATHINPHSGLWVKCFGGNSGSYQFFKDGEWEMGFGCMSNSYLEIAQPEPWNGEGLPPVGSGVCEYRGAHQWDEWTVVNIFASWGKGSSAVVFVDFGDGWREERDPERFRPIRTPEQIAEEARSAELNLMIGAIKDHPGGRHGVDHLTQLKIHEEACINLYDAGWRKQVVE